MAQHILSEARENAETFGVDVETHTGLSHRGFEEIFDSARRYGSDGLVKIWPIYTERGGNRSHRS